VKKTAKPVAKKATSTAKKAAPAPAPTKPAAPKPVASKAAPPKKTVAKKATKPVPKKKAVGPGAWSGGMRGMGAGRWLWQGEKKKKKKKSCPLLSWASILA
jgi:hypothetical protein